MSRPWRGETVRARARPRYAETSQRPFFRRDWPRQVAAAPTCPHAAPQRRLHRGSAARPEKRATYECGEEPIGSAWRKSPVGFYLLALLFILFDAEAAFIFVWILGLAEIGPVAFWAMVVFLAVLLVGWAYAWRRGDLRWAR